MSIDPRSFRNALGCFATGIAVVTVRPEGGDGPFGITVNSVASVSLEPPLVLFCLARASRHYQEVTACREFVLNILAEDQRDASSRFASPATQGQWREVAADLTAAGTPVLAGALAHLVCLRETVHDGGDHGIVVGRVVELDWRPEGRPLLYVRGRYGRLEEDVQG
ncbi:MAG: flavin reductase family protein [Rhodospirillaceae bacterium]